MDMEYRREIQVLDGDLKATSIETVVKIPCMDETILGEKIRPKRQP
jgi:hypothetical protein